MIKIIEKIKNINAWYTFIALLIKPIIDVFQYFSSSNIEERNSCVFSMVSIVFFVIIIAIIIRKIFTKKKESEIDIREEICADKTRIFKDNTEITQSNATEFLSLLSYKKRFLFIALTVTNQPNMIQFAILNKLMELQKYNITPLIYLTDHRTESRTTKAATRRCFEKLIKYYLQNGKYKIMNKNSTMLVKITNYVLIKISKYTIINKNLSWEYQNTLLENTTLKEITDTISKQEVVDGNTPLKSIFLPIFEIMNVYKICQKTREETFVLCGDELLEFWNLGNQKLGIKPFVFLLPKLVDLLGNRVIPRGIDNVLNTSYSNNETAKIEIMKANSYDGLLQIYAFFIFPLYMREKIELKISDNDNTLISINSKAEIFEKIKIETVNLDNLKRDLIPRIPQLMTKIQNYMYEK